MPLFSNPDAAERCPVYLIDFYFSKFPKPPETLDLFYLRPVARIPTDSTVPWFQATAIGKNTLSTFVEKMCFSAGLEKKTNHSLRASGATALFAAGVPEKLIKGVTGHKSSKSLEIYERPSMEQQLALSRVMSTAGTKFSTEVEKGIPQCLTLTTPRVHICTRKRIVQ